MIQVFLRRFAVRIKNPTATWRVGVLLVAMLAYGTTGFLYFELPEKPDLRWNDGLWWAIVTLTTVGYGDFFPVTHAGRLVVAMPLMIFGVGVLGYALSVAATALVDARSKALTGMTTLRLEDHTLLVNFPNLAKVERLVDELRAEAALGEHAAIVLVDEDLPQLPPELEARGVRYVRGNPSRDETLARACVDRAARAVLLSKKQGDPHSDDQIVAVALAIEARNPRIKTTAECVDVGTEELLRKAGCDSIVCGARFDAHFISTEVCSPGAQEVIDDLLTMGGQRLCFTPIEAEAELGGKARVVDVSAACKRQKHLLVGVRRAGRSHLNAPDDFELTRGDQLVTVGPGNLRLPLG